MTEDVLSGKFFCSVDFRDVDIDDKVHELFSKSGKLRDFLSGKSVESNLEVSRELAYQLEQDGVDPTLVFKALMQPDKTYAVKFFSLSGNELYDTYFKSLSKTSINVKLNGILMSTMLNNASNDPFNSSPGALKDLLKYSDTLSVELSSQELSVISDNDFVTNVQLIKLHSGVNNLSPESRDCKVVGYIIDKSELIDGKPVDRENLVIDNPSAQNAIDFEVRYGTTYLYSIRTVVLFTAPAILHVNGRPYTCTIKFLVSSRQSSTIKVETVEQVAPPAPVDVEFVWDYGRLNPTMSELDHSNGTPQPWSNNRGGLMIYWAFPPNSQRDIKYFQLFRRSSITHPFELIQEYDFNDVVVNAVNRSEFVSPSSYRILSVPKTYHYDDEFIVDNVTGKSSRFIYALCSIDAHGYTSGYSVQREVWFDKFKNSLQTRLISRSGAPKSYPNLYLEQDAFVDTIRVEGQRTKKMKVYFTPECYTVNNSSGNVRNAVNFSSSGAQYKFQFINVDCQKSVVLNVNVNDSRSKKT
jgi:hypothetical protein